MQQRPRSSRRGARAWLFTPMLVLMTLGFGLAAPTARADGLDHFRVEGCQPHFTNKVWTALNYIFQVTSVGLELSRCMQDARNGIKPLATRQEFTAIGPYAPCNTTDPRLREEEIFYTNPGWAFGFAQSYVSQAFRPGYPNPIRIVCSSSNSDTAWTFDRYFAGHSNAITVYLGLRTQSSRPNHQTLANSGPDLGPNFTYASSEESYPVDELAGIIAHEILHPHKFSHGTASGNECGYTSYECTGASGGRTCRANSVPEVIEACVSEVVEASIKRCSWDVAPFSIPAGGEVTRAHPVLTSTSSCSWEASIRPRDQVGFLQSSFEPVTDRLGADYAAVWAPSVENCRGLCVADLQCKSITYRPSWQTCWLKNGVPPATPGTDLTSSFVRTSLFGGKFEYNVDRPGGTVLSSNFFSLAAYCAKACYEWDACRVATFSHINPDAGTGVGICVLKSSVPGPQTSTGMVSYVK